MSIQTGNQQRIAVFSEPMHITDDSHCCLRVNAVIAKEGVYDFPEGPNGELIPCLWSRNELLKATRTARAAKITILEHPPNRVVTSQDEMCGIVEKPFFDRNKIRAILNFDKKECPPEFLEGVRLAEAKEGTPKDVSMGFYFDSDYTEGTWHGVPYSMVMRNIVIDHVATGVWKGRCSFPDCGIGGISRTSMAAFTESRVKSIGGKNQVSETETKVDEHGCKIGTEEWDGEKCVPLQPTEPKGEIDAPAGAEETPGPVVKGPEPETPPDTNKGDVDENGCYLDEIWSPELQRCVTKLDKDGPTGENRSNDPPTEANAAVLIERSRNLLKMREQRNILRLKESRRSPV